MKRPGNGLRHAPSGSRLPSTWSVTVLRDADMKPHLGGPSGASVAARRQLVDGSRLDLRSMRAAATGRSMVRLPISILAAMPVILPTEFLL